MEAIGIILAVIPIVVSALQSYKSGKTLKSRVQNRKGHIAELVRSLKGYQAALEGYLEWVLKGADVEFNQFDDVETVTAVLSDQAVIEDVREFLGKSAANAVIETIEACVLALYEISCSINELLPALNNAADSHTNVKLIATRFGVAKEVPIWKGIKLAFSKSDLDAQIQKIDRITGLLDKLQSSRTAIGQLDVNEPTRKSRHMVKALTRISYHAERLHKALKAGWAPGCHETHEANLFLEDRLPATRPRKQPEVQFKLIFSGGHRGNLIWHENHVQVLEEEEEALSQTTLDMTIKRVSKVTIIGPAVPAQVTLPSRKQIQNLCLCISEAQKSQLHLELYLLSHSVIHYSHTPIVASKPPSNPSTISLEKLIVSASASRLRSQRLPLISRLRLALVLASTTLQLGSTSWLNQPWSKETICFISKLSTTDGALNASNIELTKPTLRETFTSTTAPQNLTGARVVLLELGIILLELWNEITIEQHYEGTDVVIRKDYFTRLSLAQQWLEDSLQDILPAYYDAVARLVKCHFDGIPVNPTWDDQNLQCGLVKCVIEPLQRQCSVGSS